MTVLITPAHIEDAPIIHRITHEAFAQYEGVLQPPTGALSETVADVERAMAEGGAVLCWEGQNPVGAARFSSRGKHLYVGRVAVLPSHRKQGVASAMMRYLEEMAAQQGFTAVEVGVRMSLAGNLALYRRLGYEIVDVAPHPRGPDHVATLLKRVSSTPSC